MQAVCHRDALPALRVLTTSIDTETAVDQLRDVQGPVGVACYDDEVALTLLAATRVLGLDVPGQIGLIGVDRIPLGQIGTPVLTSVEDDPVDIAHRLRDSVLSELGRETPADVRTATTFRVARGGTT